MTIQNKELYELISVILTLSTLIMLPIRSAKAIKEFDSQNIDKKIYAILLSAFIVLQLFLFLFIKDDFYSKISDSVFISGVFATITVFLFLIKLK